MRKFFISILFLSLFSVSLAANSYGSENIEAFAIFQKKGSLPAEEAWIPDQCEKRLRSNLLKYTDFKLISSNDDSIANFQRDMELSNRYKNEINIGQFTNASHVIYITAEKLGRYSVTVSVASVTSSEELFSETVERDTTSGIYSDVGNAIDEITISLCEALGQPLSKSIKDILKYGEDSLTNDDLLQMHQEEIEKNQARLDDLEKEMLSISQDTSEIAIARQKEIEIELAQTRAKEKKAIEAQRRAQEEQELDRIEAQRASQRSAEQINRIKETSESINNKIQDVRNMKLENASLVTQLNIIESLKKSYTEVENKIKAERYSIDRECANAISDAEYRIMNAPVDYSDRDSQGNMLSRERTRRNNMIESETKKILQQGEIDKITFENEMKSSKDTILSEINKGYAALGRTQTITTLARTKDLIVNFGNYDGERFGWDLYITVQDQDMIIFQAQSFLSYKTLTGKEPFVTTKIDLSPLEKRKDQDYRETVDYYFSMFARGEPILTFALDYKATPAPENEPSKYTFSFSNFRYYETTKLNFSDNKIKGYGTELIIDGDSDITRQLYPAYDIRDEITIRMEEEAKRKADNRAREEFEQEQERILAAEEKKYEAEMRKAENKAKRNAFFSKDWGRTLLGIGGGALFGDMTGGLFEVELSYGFFPYLYAGYTMDFINLTQDNTKTYNFYGQDSISVFSNMFEFGSNIEIGSFGCFFSCGLGFNVYTPKIDASSPTTPVYPDSQYDPYYPGYYATLTRAGAAVSIKPETQVDFIVTLSGGFSFILLEHLDLNVSLDYKFLPLKTDNSKSTKSSRSNSSSSSSAEDFPPCMLGINIGAAFRL